MQCNVRDKVSHSELKEYTPYVNAKRGGYCMNESYYCNSGQSGLMTGLENVTSPPMRSRSSGVVHESPSMLGDAPAVLTEPSIPVAPMHYTNRVRSESVRSENDIIRQGTVNNEALAHRVTDEVTSRRSVIPAAAVDLNEGGMQNDSEGEWVRVVRRRGTRTSRFKAANLQHKARAEANPTPAGRTAAGSQHFPPPAVPQANDVSPDIDEVKPEANVNDG
ncbi:unnamed protein product [Parnassius apollo]|uniref:(apollo) hypothetical protein n=1 Tax=Parnassius apollo TaxID=110799 RepID=A0A8S3WXQ6_PARAO|nr:unnamed protein product [Parnassius apollo]